MVSTYFFYELQWECPQKTILVFCPTTFVETINVIRPLRCISSLVVTDSLDLKVIWGTGNLVINKKHHQALFSFILFYRAIPSIPLHNNGTQYIPAGLK